MVVYQRVLIIIKDAGCSIFGAVSPVRTSMLVYPSSKTPAILVIMSCMTSVIEILNQKNNSVKTLKVHISLRSGIWNLRLGPYWRTLWMSHCKVSCCKALEANPETFSSRLPRNSSLRARNIFFCISCWNLKSTADVYNVTHIYIHYIIYNTYKYVYIYTVYIYTHYLCTQVFVPTHVECYGFGWHLRLHATR